MDGKFERERSSRSEGLSNDERRLLEKARGHFRTVKEEIERVEWCMTEYSKGPSDERWNQMISELNILSNVQTTPTLLVTDLNHARGKRGDLNGWPKGTQSWEN
jgi:hypothetical protein